jgi:hypothetical protein
MVIPENRDKTGRFKPGKSGNPGGRKRQPPDVKAALEAATSKAAQTLVILLDSENERVALQAATVILDRVYGRPETSGNLNLNAAIITPASILAEVETRRQRTTPSVA